VVHVVFLTSLVNDAVFFNVCVQLGISNCFAFFHYAYRFTQYDLKVKGTLR